MPPVRGRSRRRGEVSPRRDFSPRRRRVIRSRNRDRFRDRERDIDRRNRERDIDRLGREERRANDLMQSAYNLSAKNTQRQKDRLRSQTEAFNKYLEKQRDKFNQAQGPKVQPPAKRRRGPPRTKEIRQVAKKMPDRVPRAPAGWKRDPKTGSLMKSTHNDMRKGGLFYK